MCIRDSDTIVDDLVEIENVGDLPDEDILSRYYPQLQSTDNFGMDNTKWFYRMINSKKPLQEKMTLFWHHVFATGWTKSEQGPTMIDHIAMLRKNCLLNLRVLLTDLAADPAMIFWLDNCENHGKNINENFGRELLELFSRKIIIFCCFAAKIEIKIMLDSIMKKKVKRSLRNINLS